MTVPSPHNLTLMSNSTGVVGFMLSVNDNLMFGLFGSLLLVTIFILTYLTFFATTNSAGKSMMGSSFICFIMSLFLRIVGLVPDVVLYASLVLMAFSIAMLKGDN